MMCVCPAFVLFGLLVIGVPHVQGVTDASQGPQSITIEAGEDVYLPCETSAHPRIYIWERNNRSVEAISTYRDNRLYVMKSQGLLILNTQNMDSGIFRCTTFSQGSFGTAAYDLRVVDRAEPDEDHEAIQCGYVKQRSRVIGGREVNAPGIFPWMVLLWHKELSAPFCGGALLSRRFVVTAAHCFESTGYDSNQVEVRLGEFNISTTESYERTISIAEMIYHPSYDRDTFDSDIMLLRLEEPVIFSDYIVPICLPSELRGETLLQTGTRGIVAGWGRTSADTSHRSDVLKRAKLTIRDFETCGAQHSDIITSNMFCALGGNRQTNVRDACNGDSGGPFIVEVEDRSYLVGIVSWGIGCGDIDRPGVYTRVSRFRSWILEYINSDLQTCEETSFQTEEDLNQEQSKIQALEGQVEDLTSQLEMYKNQEEPVCTTPSPIIPSTATPPYHETPIPCRRGSCWHIGGYRVWGQCVNSVCECNSPYYSSVTCLPKIGSCNIHDNDPGHIHATPLDSGSRPTSIYSCVGDVGRTTNVHILGVYEGNVHTRPPTAGTMNVHISPSSATAQPVVLVFSSYEPVNWVLDYPASLTIEKVILISYYKDLCSVTFDEGNTQDPPTIEKKPRSMPRGYGKDSGGGNTAGMMLRLSQIYGSITSFAGTYKADSWTWTLPVGHGGSSASDETAGGDSSSSSGNPSANVNEDSWTEYSFRSDDNWNSCRGSKYVRKRPITDGQVGQFVGATLCSSTRYKLFMSDDLNGIFQNIADTNGHGQDHCEFLGAPSDGDYNLDVNFWHSPSSTGYYRGGWGDDMQMGVIGGGMGSSWTGRYYPKWYECGVEIP